MFPSLHGLPAHEPQPMAGSVAPLPSTGVVMSPKREGTLSEPDDTEALELRELLRWQVGQQRPAPIERLRQLILRGWTQNANARDAHGVEVIGGDLSRAAAWSLSGAVLWALSGEVAFRISMAIAEVLGGPFMCTWNDAPGRTQADVLALLDALPTQLAIVDSRYDASRPRSPEASRVGGLGRPASFLIGFT